MAPPPFSRRPSHRPARHIEQRFRAEGEWAATFTYPTGGKEAIDTAKSILLDCVASAPANVTVSTLAIIAKNAKSLMGE